MKSNLVGGILPLSAYRLAIFLSEFTKQNYKKEDCIWLLDWIVYIEEISQSNSFDRMDESHISKCVRAYDIIENIELGGFISNDESVDFRSNFFDIESGHYCLNFYN